MICRSRECGGRTTSVVSHGTRRESFIHDVSVAGWRILSAGKHGGHFLNKKHSHSTAYKMLPGRLGF